MRRSLQFVAVVVAAVSAAPGAANASGPDRVVQDDTTVVCGGHDRQRALEQMREAGFTHVHISVVHARGPDGVGLVACGRPSTLQEYDSAVAAVRAAGLVPQVTLVWYGQSDPAAIAAWMGEIAAHFAGRVQRFSVLNEPDLSIPARDHCDPPIVARMLAAGTLKPAPPVKRYLRHLVRVRRHGRTVKAWRYVYRLRAIRVRSGAGHRYVIVRERVYRWITPSSLHADDSAAQAVPTPTQECLRIQRGRMYREIFDAAEPAIRAAAPGAQVLAGETSSVAGVELFIEQALPLHADGWAQHCYQWDLTPSSSAGGFGIGDTPRVQALVGMPLFYTECGYPNADSKWNQLRWNGLFTHDNLPGAYTEMWQYARDQGVREMGQFGWCEGLQGRWDTSLMAPGPECAPSPEYVALQRLIASWP